MGGVQAVARQRDSGASARAPAHVHVYTHAHNLLSFCGDDSPAAEELVNIVLAERKREGEKNNNKNTHTLRANR